MANGIDINAILSQLPSRRKNTLVDYDPISLTDVRTPTKEESIVSMAVESLSNAANAYVESEKLKLQNNLKVEEIRFRERQQSFNEKIQNENIVNQSNRDILSIVNELSPESQGAVIESINTTTDSGSSLKEIMIAKRDSDLENQKKALAFESKFGNQSYRELKKSNPKELNEYLSNPWNNDSRKANKNIPLNLKAQFSEYLNHKDYYDWVDEDGYEKMVKGTQLENLIPFGVIKTATYKDGINLINKTFEARVKNFDKLNFEKNLKLMTQLTSRIKSKESMLNQETMSEKEFENTKREIKALELQLNNLYTMEAPRLFETDIPILTGSSETFSPPKAKKTSSKVKNTELENVFNYLKRFENESDVSSYFNDLRKGKRMTLTDPTLQKLLSEYKYEQE